ncbi:MAG TPA: hypothetical protein VEH04_11100 [Verrucomicrobiae bacterium]|nr:hypothetical protein [Verrucomicrobiae bacterium]
MTDILRLLLREPVLTGSVSVCLAIVFGLIWSGQAEKRRTRELLRAKEAARLGNSMTKPQKTTFKLFRWEFAAVSLVAAFFVLPGLDGEKVEAKQGAEPNNAAVASGEVPESRIAEAELPPEAPAGSNAMTVVEGGVVDPNALFSYGSEAEWEELPASGRPRSFAPSTPALEGPISGKTAFAR